MNARTAIAIVFTCFGTVMGIWGGSIAEVNRLASVNTLDQGYAIVAFGVAGIIGFLLGGRIAVSISIKNRLMIFLALEGCALFAALHSSSATAIIIGIFIFSLLGAATDLAMNAEGLAVEDDLGAPILSRFHGLASLGMAAGAISGSYLSVRLGVTVTALVGLAVVAFAVATVWFASPDRGPTEASGFGFGLFKPSTPFIVVSIIVGASIAIEIGTTLFSAQTIVSQAPKLAAYAGAAGMIYSIIQGSVRLTGDRLRHRYGDRKVIRGSLFTVTAGLLLVTISRDAPQSVAGFALIGAGTACLVPAGFALAKRYTGRSGASSIALAILIGSPFRIIAPLAFGTIADSQGYGAGFGAYALVAIAVTILAFFHLEKPLKGRIP